MDVPDLSLVVPMYNEEASCAGFFEAVLPILNSIGCSFEIICVNDGSKDETLGALKRARNADSRIKIVNLSRNFGKEAAMTAGIDIASGKAVVPMDADLQDPPELLLEMYARWRSGAQVVLAKRVDRSSDSALKRITSSWFYDIFALLTNAAIPKDVGDFRLMDRVVVNALKSLPERSRFMKGLFAWVGYRQETIEYTRPLRAAGTTKFNYIRLWNFALDGIFSFSAVPLKIWSYFGALVSVSAILFMIYLIAKTLVTGVDTPGYASLLSIMLFLNGMVLLSLGAIGEYLSRIFVEVKQRPVYLINELDGFAPARSEPLTINDNQTSGTSEHRPTVG